MPKVSYFTVSNAPGVPPKGKTIYCCGSPHPKKNDFSSRYVCVFVPVLMAKTTIGKSMCVFVCNPCVCFVPSVCVFGVQSVCVFVADFSPQITWSVWACLKKRKVCHFTRVFTFKMTCAIRVCVCGGQNPTYFNGENAI